MASEEEPEAGSPVSPLPPPGWSFDREVAASAVNSSTTAADMDSEEGVAVSAAAAAAADLFAPLMPPSEPPESVVPGDSQMLPESHSQLEPFESPEPREDEGEAPSAVEPRPPPGPSTGRPQPCSPQRSVSLREQSAFVSDVDLQFRVQLALKRLGADREGVKDLIWSEMLSSQGSTRPGSSQGAEVTSLNSSSPTTLQSKAAWATPHWRAVNAVPDYGEADVLNHRNLEVGIVQHVMNTVPNHGVDQVLVNDTVSLVVRDLVGTIEALVDRVLTEKKHETIRDMVSEHMTEGLASTVEAGRETMRREEFGRLIEDGERLRAEVQQLERSWGARFGEVSELREAQGAMWACTEQRCKDLEARVSAWDRDGVLKAHLDERMQVVSSDIEALRAQARAQESSVDACVRQSVEFEAFARSTFAEQVKVESSVASLEKAIQSLREHTDRGLEAIRAGFTPLDRFERLEAEHGRQLSELARECNEAAVALSKLEAEVEQDRRDSMATLATKKEVEASARQLGSSQEALGKELKEALAELDARSADKQVVDDLIVSTKKSLTEVAGQLEGQGAMLGSVAADVKHLQELCGTTLATREYAMEVAIEQGRKAANEADDTQEIAKLRSEFEEEKERNRSQARHLQASREALNEAQEMLHAVNRQATDCEQRCSDLESKVSAHAENEAEERRHDREDLSSLRSAHTELHASVEAAHKALQAHQDFQRAEDDKLRQHSTERYLEQIDKALKLSGAVGRLEEDHKGLEAGHRELKETVIKLPKV